MDQPTISSSKHQITKTTFIGYALVCSVVIQVLFVGYMGIKFVQRRRTQSTGTLSAEHMLKSDQEVMEVATDPRFMELNRALLPGIPEIPTYPGATLVGSAKVTPQGEPDGGYRIKWESQASVPQIMAFYEVELPKRGWSYEKPDDYASMGEQVAKISKGDFTGYIAAEQEGNIQEIIVDLRLD